MISPKKSPREAFRILNGFCLNGSHLSRFLNDPVSGFEIPFKIRTICKPNSFQTFKIWANLDFRSPLYNWLPFLKVVTDRSSTKVVHDLGQSRPKPVYFFFVCSLLRLFTGFLGS